MAETRIVTMIVSNIPDAPEPMFPSSSVGCTAPVASMMMVPEKMPVSSTRNTLMPATPPTSTSRYGTVCSRWYSGISTAPISLFSENTRISASATSAAGSAMRKFVRNLSFISQPCVLQAAMVVSEMNERLSPNIAPPMTEPMHSARWNPDAFATATAMGTISVIVPQDVPMAVETKHETMNSTATANRAGICASMKYATDSALLRPTTPTNTPAARKIRIIVIMFLSPTPFAMTSSLSSNDSARFCRQATRIAARNATTIGML